MVVLRWEGCRQREAEGETDDDDALVAAVLAVQLSEGRPP